MALVSACPEKETLSIFHFIFAHDLWLCLSIRFMLSFLFQYRREGERDQEQHPWNTRRFATAEMFAFHLASDDCKWKRLRDEIQHPRIKKSELPTKQPSFRRRSSLAYSTLNLFFFGKKMFKMQTTLDVLHTLFSFRISRV